MQARDEKLLEGALDAVYQRVKELKSSLELMLVKLETEYESPNFNWPSFLDSFALISSQLNGLNKLLRSEKCPLFRNFILLPLHLSPDRDPELEKMTEGRVISFNHEVVPDYLRTKPEPEVEEKQQLFLNKATQVNADQLIKQINSLSRITNNVIDVVRSNRDEMDSERKTQLPQTSSMQDTNLLIAATSFGKGLKPTRPGPQMMPNQPQQRMTPPPQQPQQPHIPMPNITMSKAQSSVKGNLKNAGNMHPYNR